MKEKGQALITLIVAVTVSLLILITAALASVSQGKNSSRSSLGNQVYDSAEAGLEYAVIRMMRQPSVCSSPASENVTLGGVDIQLSYTPFLGSCVVASKAQNGNIIKTVRILANYNSNQVFDVCCWLEIP